MSIFNIPLESINKESLENLINVVPEGRQLDYKRDLNFSTPDQKRELYKDVASFATASGGDIIYGLDENPDTTPKQIVPLQITDFDKLRLSIELGVRSILFPRINIQIHPITCKAGLVIIIRVLKSFQGPVALKDGDTYRFYSRHSTGKYPLDYLEVKNHFIQSNTINDMFKNFRAQRIDYYLSGENGNDPSKPFMLFYIYPMNDTSLNIGNIPQQKLIEALFPFSLGGSDYTYNIEGFLMFNHNVNENENSLTQNQLFYNGTVEIYDDRLLSIKQNPNQTIILVHLHVIENKIIENFSKIIEFYKEHSIVPPFICNLSFINVKNSSASLDWVYGYPFNFKKNIRDNLIFREFIIDTTAENFKNSLRPIFDDLWRAYGVSKSNSFNESGVFSR